MLRRFVIRTLIAAVVLALAGAAGGCVSTADREADRSLDAVERLLRADSAAQATEAIARVDTAAISSRAVAARYAMLHAYTRYKNYIDDTAMTYLAPALDYYCGPSPKGPDRYRALTLFLKGKYYKKANRYADAIEAFLDADDNLVDPKEFLLRGFIRQSIADCYQSTFNGREQLRYCLLAQDEFRHSIDSDYIAWGWADIAQAYQNTFDFPNAIRYSDSVITYADRHSDAYLKSYAHLVKARSLSSQLRKTDAISNYAEVIRLRPADLSIFDKVFIQNNAYFAKDTLVELQSVDDFISRLDSNDLKSPYVLYLQGKYKDAFHQLKAIEDSIARNLRSAIKEEVSTRTVQTRESRIELQKRVIASNRLVLFFMAIVALLVVAISFFAFRYRTVQHKARETELILQARRLVEEVNGLKTLTGSQWNYIEQSTEALDALVRGVLTGRPDAANQSQSIAESISFLSAELSSPETIKSLERIVDARSGGAITAIRTSSLTLSEADYTLIAYWGAGFSQKTIATLTRVAPDKIYRRRYKLRKRLADAGLTAAASLISD